MTVQLACEAWIPNQICTVGGLLWLTCDSPPTVQNRLGLERVRKQALKVEIWEGGWEKRARETRPPKFQNARYDTGGSVREGAPRHSSLQEGRPALKSHGRLLAKLGVSNSAYHCGNSLEFTQHRPVIVRVLPRTV